MKIRTEIKVGLVAIVSITILYFGIVFLKGRDLFKVENSYYAVFDNVEGLYKSNYVYLSGMKIGYIKDIDNMDAIGRSFLVHVSIKNEIQLPDDSEIMIFSSDLLGSKALKVLPGKSQTALKNKDTICSLSEIGFLDQLSQDISPAISNLGSVIAGLDTLLTSINAVLDHNSIEHLKSGLESLRHAGENIDNFSLKLDNLMESEQRKIKNILASAEDITQNINQNNDKLNTIINNFNDISDTIARAKLGHTIRETNLSLRSLSSILTSIENGEGSIGLLLKDDSLYINLESTAKKLDELVEDIIKNPKKYLKVSVF